jgi:hypothetical protein
MSRIRDALSQVPSKPGFAIALLVALALGGWYLISSWTTCSGLRADRQRLLEAVEAAGQGSGILDLATAFPGPFDEVRIVQGHRLQPGERPYHCPFGWDLTADERNALIEKGDYTLIGLFSGGRFARYVEWRGDWARFEGDVSRLPAAARLKVTRSGSGPYILAPVTR